MSRRRTMVTGVLALLVVAAAVLTWRVWEDPAEPVTVPGVGSDGLYLVGSIHGEDTGPVAAAASAVPFALSYDHRLLERNLAAATSRMTVEFAEEYRTTFDASVRPLARKEKAVTEARVRAAGLVRRDGEEALCLVFVDQVLVASAELTRSRQPVKVGQNRVLVRLVRVGDTWKVDDIRPR
jgi:hypothetical protein